MTWFDEPAEWVDYDAAWWPLPAGTLPERFAGVSAVTLAVSRESPVTTQVAGDSPVTTSVLLDSKLMRA